MQETNLIAGKEPTVGLYGDFVKLYQVNIFLGDFALVFALKLPAIQNIPFGTKVDKFVVSLIVQGLKASLKWYFYVFIFLK